MEETETVPVIRSTTTTTGGTAVVTRTMDLQVVRSAAGIRRRRGRMTITVVTTARH